MCRAYLWGGSEDKKHIALVSWDKVRVPKMQGGFNIKECGTWNKASNGKLAWQLATNQESLWVKWVHGIDSF